MNNWSISDNLIGKKFITPKEFGELLRISQPTAYRLINSRKIPSYKIGNQTRLYREDVITYLKISRRDQMKI